MMLRPRIDQIDMHRRDESALVLLRKSVDPETHFSLLTVSELAARLPCHRNTARRILDRLEGAGYVRRHNRRRYLKIEVLPDGCNS